MKSPFQKGDLTNVATVNPPSPPFNESNVICTLVLSFLTCTTTNYEALPLTDDTVTLISTDSQELIENVGHLLLLADASVEFG